MGKNDFLTPKAIANRIKAKGLQKLRWYCQMCQKQCRDENGFKCHLTSESHRRQMMVFGENPDRVLRGYSEEFESTFLEMLKRSHPNTRISAKVVYNEYINDRHHVHMNATKWLTLTDFVKYLGKTGKCKVDQTEKGWHILLIQQDPMEMLSEERRVKRHKEEKEEEERQKAALEEQIARAQQTAKPDEGPAQATELHRDEGNGEPLKLSMGAAVRGPSRLSQSSSVLEKRPAPGFGDDGRPAGGREGKGREGARPKSKQEEIMEREQAAKRQRLEREAAEAKKAAGRQDAPWLQEHIVVKVMSKELKEHGYYKQKGVVEKLVTKFVAQISMLESGDVLQVDQAQLETVLPSPGGQVRVLAGEHRGARATMVGLDTQKFKAEVRLKTGDALWLDYEDVCKTHSS